MNMIPEFLKDRAWITEQNVANAWAALDAETDVRIADELERALTTPASRAKDATSSAREELEAEIRQFEDDILTREGRILGHEAAISEERGGIAGDKVLIAERKAVIAILDRTKADIEAIGKASAPSPKPDKPKKRAGEAKAG